MALFNFGKKKEENCCTPGTKSEASCCCSNESGGSKAKTARFIVLGACCKRSSETFENTKVAVRELGFSDEVINLGDNIEIAKFGVMQTPALVIDGKVVSYGKLLSVEDVKKIFEKLGVK